MTNIVMISFDDLNDWSSVLGGYAGTVYTPNLQRLADTSAAFQNAFSPSPVCNPARSTTLTGMSPVSTGVFANEQLLFDRVDPSRTLPYLLREAGYETATAGKVFHELPEAVAASLYDRVLIEQENGAEKTPDNVRYTTSTLDTGVYLGDPAELTDVRTATAVTDFLAGYVPDAADAGLFLSVGFSRPHSPWVVPQEYFDLYPLDDIVLPDTALEDLADVPAFAEFFASRDLFDKVVAANDLRAFIQAYLATVSYADARLGDVLDAIAASAIAGDTVIALWSDHGYHLGDKESVGKFTLWEEAARSNLIIHDPNAVATAGAPREEVVGLVDLYSTLLDYAGVAIPAWAEGDSLRDLIETGADPTLRGYAVTSIIGSHTIRTETWRYTRYEDGTEELYNVAADPGQLTNLAAAAETLPIRAELLGVLGAYLAELPTLQNLDAATPTRLEATTQHVLIAGTALDTLVGGADDTVYVVRAPTVVIREAEEGGHDLVIARNSYRLPDEVEDVQFISKTALPGTPTLVGNALDNRMVVLSGSATLDGGRRDDTLLGGSGFDSLFGNQGDDLIEAGGGNDTIDGGGGDDVLVGVKGDDLYRLSLGIDRIAESADNGYDVIDLTAWGGFAGTRIELLVGENGKPLSLVLSQMDGTAVTTIEAVGGGINVEALRAGSTVRLLTEGTLVGGVPPEAIEGSAGDDTLAGLGDADRLDGAGGDDRLEGGAGDDVLIGGAGNDTLDGGFGNNLASYAGAAGPVVVRLDVGQASGDGVDLLLGIQHAAGSAFGDLMVGSGGGNRLAGSAGDDTLTGLSGNDVLAGGAGADVLSGGSGADRFVFDPADAGSVDRITDFNRRGDKLDLGAIADTMDAAGRNALRYVGAAEFTGAGQIRSVATEFTTVVEVNWNDDLAADLTISLDGILALNPGSFLL